MNWLKLAGDFHSHPKMKRMQSRFPRRWRRAVSLWTLAGSWCAAHEKDGVIEREMLPMFLAELGDAEMLVDVGLWDVRPDNSWAFHDWFDYQLTANQLRTSREKAVERAQTSRERRNVAAQHAPPVPSRLVEKISSEKEEENSKAVCASYTAPESTRARFENPPVGEAAPNTPPTASKPIRPEARCWQLYQRALGTEHLMLPPNHQEALQALASAAKAESDGAAHGEAFDRAVERILGVWMAEKYWQDKKPGLRNLKERLEEGKYARPKSKPIVKAALRLSEQNLSDAELLALDSFQEFDLALFQKHRRWELIRRKENAEDAAALRLVQGGAS